jgi:tetratricopeptide (TPR) repeat protein
MKSIERRSHAGSLESETMQRTDHDSTRDSARGTHRALRTAILTLGLVAVTATGAALAYQQYRVLRWAGVVRRSFAARRYQEARTALHRWLRERPHSAEAAYYRAWLALVDQDPDAAVRAFEQAKTSGIDPSLLRPLTGVYQARANRINDAEPILREAFEQQREPQVEVARELARIYLVSYRLPEAGVVLTRWRTLAPEDPQPYLWSNEVAARSNAEPAVLVQNYRAALERDPNLDKARLGLAEQLSKDRRYDEAEREYRAYLERHPEDAKGMVGLGRNALQGGDLAAASTYFETALRANPREPEALKELAQTDLRLGRFAQAAQRFERLTEIEPYDHEVRYSFAQALKLKGDEVRARSESELAARLREQHDRILGLRHKILQDPKDLGSRQEVARWMLEHGHAEEGLKWTREILRADPHHAPTHRLLADYYQKQGDSGLANYHRLMASSASR